MDSGQESFAICDYLEYVPRHAMYVALCRRLAIPKPGTKKAPMAGWRAVFWWFLCTTYAKVYGFGWCGGSWVTPHAGSLVGLPAGDAAT